MDHERVARIFKALGHPTRLWMVDHLRKGELCVREFVDRTELDFSTISRHLSLLKEAGIVSDRKEGKQVFYRINFPCIIDMISCMEQQASDSFALETCRSDNRQNCCSSKQQTGEE